MSEKKGSDPKVAAAIVFVVGLLAILTGSLSAAKVWGPLDLPWVVVLAPMWFPYVVCGAIVACAFVSALITALTDRVVEHR